MCSIGKGSSVQDTHPYSKIYKVPLPLASYADALWARDAIFLPHECVTSPKSVCVGGYPPPGQSLPGELALLTFEVRSLSSEKQIPKLLKDGQKGFHGGGRGESNDISQAHISKFIHRRPEGQNVRDIMLLVIALRFQPFNKTV